MQLTPFWERVVYRVVFRLFCSPNVLVVLCLFVALVEFRFHYEDTTLVLITPVPDHCYFFHTIRSFLKFCLLIYLISCVFVVLCLKYKLFNTNTNAVQFYSHIHSFAILTSSVIIINLLCLESIGGSMMYYHNWFLSQVTGN